MKPLLILSLLSFFQSASAIVPTAKWRQVQLRGEGYFQALAVAPSYPPRFFVSATSSGVFRTDNSAESWIWAGSGLPLNATALALAVDPNDPDVVLAGYKSGFGLWKSEDAGQTWALSSSGLGTGSVRSVRFDPHHNSVCFAGISGGSGAGIYRSNDGGTTWFALSAAGVVDSFDFAFHPTLPNIVLAATSAGTMRSTSEGESWVLTIGHGNLPSQRLSWCVSEPSIVYATTAGGVLKSEDSGVGFDLADESGAFSLQYDSEHLRPIECDPDDPRKVWAGGELWVDWETLLVIPSLVRSTNGGASWQWSLTEGNLTDVHYDMALPTFVQRHPSHPDVVYAGMSASLPSDADGRMGFMRSNSGGAQRTWVPKMNGIGNVTLGTVAKGTDGEMYVAGAGFRVFWKRGSPWQIIDDIPSQDTDDLVAFEVNPRHPRSISLLGIGGAYDARTPFYARSTDDGNHWSEHYDLYVERAFLTTAHGTGNVVYVWADESWPPHHGRPTVANMLYRSDDSGEHFDQIGSVDSVTAAVVHPGGDFFVISAGRRKDPVQFSPNGGDSWFPLSDGLPAGHPVSLLMDPATQFLTVVFDDGSSYRSTSFSAPWTSITLPIPGAEVIAADWDPVQDRLYFATKEDGVYISDHGFANEGLNVRDLSSISFSPSLGLLFVTSYSGGLWERKIPRTAAEEEVASHRANDVLPAHPNPFEKEVAFELPQDLASEFWNLSIFDVGGRLIHSSTGTNQTRIQMWNGMGTDGGKAPAGIYFVRFTSGSHEATNKLILLR